MDDLRSYLLKARRALRRSLFWVREHVPWGLRTLLGLVLIVGGVFGFLPVLGFWMIPLGLAVILLDVRAVAQVVRKYLARR